VGVAYGDRRPQWAWSRSDVKQSRSRTVLWPITPYSGFYTTSVSESGSPDNIANTVSQKTIKGISSKFSHRCTFGFINVLVRFWG